MTEFTFGKWYPIETAPKDGRSILVVSPCTSIDDVSCFDVVSWRRNEWIPDSGGDVFDIWTKWMPLPPPPIGESN